MQTKKAYLEDLQRVVGKKNVREATPEDAVEGVVSFLQKRPAQFKQR